MTALSDELATMTSWSPASIAMTFASLYLTEFMGPPLQQRTAPLA
jgi:putative DNA primase/helicase